MLDIVLTTWLLVIIFIFGSAIASFFTVVSQRGFKASLGGRSHCDHCQKTLPAWVLAPFFSTLYLLAFKRSRSACCNHKISLANYLFSEVIGGISAILLFFNLFGQTNIGAVIAFTLVSVVFLYLAIDDIWHLGIETAMLGILGMLLLTVGIITPGSWEAVTDHRIFSVDSLIGAALYGGIIAGLMILTKGKGLGLGDLILIVIMAFSFGTWSLTIALQATLYSALVFGVTYSIYKRKFKGLIIPLVPFLLIGWLAAGLLLPTIEDFYGGENPLQILVDELAI